MSELMQTVKQWVRSFRGDVEAIKAVIESPAIDERGRKLAATALNYLVTRLDLIPDWNETIGLMDDVMVLRVCMAQARAYDFERHLDDDTRLRVASLIGDVDTIAAILGDELYGKFSKYCARLIDNVVRGRSAETIVDDDSERAALYKEIDEDILRMPPPSFDRPDDVMLRFTSYLHHKLGT